MKRLLHSFSWLFRASREKLQKNYIFHLVIMVIFITGCGVGYYVGHDRGIILPSSIHQADVSDEGLRTQQLKNNEALVIDQIESARPTEKTVRVKGGDTLVTLLTSEGVDKQVAHTVAVCLKEHCDPKKLKPGQLVTMAVKPSEQDDEKPDLLRVSLKVDDVREVHASKGEEGRFDVWMEEKELTKELAYVKGSIDGSFFGSSTEAGVPATVVVDIIHALSHRIDLQRDIQPGDKFEIAYERFVDHEGKVMGEGKAQYVTLESHGKRTTLYRHKNRHGENDFYLEDGSHLKRGFMRTPVDGARLSSGFGRRKDPFLNYTRMHRGVDFGAPQGTPVYAAGDGIVTKMGWHGGYGRYIQIKHNQEYATAYAHLHRFAANLKIGGRVRQGQKIAEVGSTGRSTGPHLHYEVHRFGQQINPSSVKMVGGKKLEGRDYHYFKACLNSFNKQLASLKTDDGETKLVALKIDESKQKAELAEAKIQSDKIPETEMNMPAPEKLVPNIRAKPRAQTRKVQKKLSQRRTRVRPRA